ncbi:uncharacterized protein DNG_03944 [Cephalotrichum gorgonifer]|uniref:Uncharacterized protein n=1 Tax=Cephalotrichum gorgonifer TaxID=2041049 RepID=A0AAE8MXX4_9PEZI|nr:uncharacterized protein DNG_03944 [Cephalotrichum gorgonifer]
MAPTTPADYGLLAALGFEPIVDCVAGLEAAYGTIRNLRSNQFVLAVTNGEGLAKDPQKLLASASGNVFSLSSLPITPFRAVSAYSRLLSALVPGTKDAETLATSLETVAKRLSAIDDAAKDISSASQPISAAWKKVGLFKKLLTAAAPGGKPPAPFMSVVADCLQPITGPLNTSDPISQQRLFSLAGLVISPKNIAKSFQDIKRADPAEASKIVQAWSVLENNLNVSVSTFAHAISTVETLVGALNSVSTAINNIPIGFTQFRRSISNPPADFQGVPGSVVDSWKAVDANLQSYITLAVKGPAAATALALAVQPPQSRAAAMELAATAPTTAADVRDKFGPPSYVETLLADLGPESGKVNDSLNKFLSLPYVNALKVTTKQGQDTDLRSQVLDIRQKYLDLQQKSVPIARDINAYALLTETLLPHVNQPGGVPLNTFLEQNVILVVRHGQQAKSIAEETRTLQQEYQNLLDTLEANLTEVVQRIRDLEAELEKAEDEFRLEVATAIIEGITTAAFIIGAVASLMAGDIPAAGELAIKGGLSAYETVQAAIMANTLAGVIASLESAIKVAKETKAELETAIPLFDTIITMMGKIGSAWDMISENLGHVKDTYELWANPELFTPPYLQLAMEAWEAVRQGVQIYVDIVTSDITGVNNGVAAVPLAGMLKKPAGTPRLPAAPRESGKAACCRSLHKREIPPEPVHTTPAFAVLLATASSNEVNKFFSAPTLRGHPAGPDDFRSLAIRWKTIAGNLDRVGESDLASNCNSVADAILTRTLPSAQHAVDTLLTFARQQPVVPTLPVSEKDWEAFYTSRAQSLKEGEASTAFVDANLRDTQTQANNVYSFSKGRVIELQMQIDDLTRREYELEQQRDLQNQILSRLLGGFFGLDSINALSFGWGIPGLPSIPGIPNIPGIPIPGVPDIPGLSTGDDAIDAARNAIADLTSAITGVVQQRTVATNAVMALQNALTVVEQSRDTLGGLAQLSSDIALFWADLETQMSTAVDLWQPLQNMQELEIDLYRTTWAVVVSAFGSWEDGGATE